MPYAPLFGPWSADAIADATTPGPAPNFPYPLDWLMPAQANPAAPVNPQFAAPPQPAPPTVPAWPANQNYPSAPVTTAGSPDGSTDVPPWPDAIDPRWPLARAPWVAPEWVSTYSLLGRVGQLQNPFVPDGPPRDMSMSLFPRPPCAAEELPPRGSLLFDRVRAAQPGLIPVDQEPNSDGGDQAAKDLIAPGLPISKSGAPFFPPPPQPSLVPPSLSRSLLDIASLVAPNLVDYFTKPVPPQAPFPSTPGKIPSGDFNPYTGPALQEAVDLGLAVAAGAESVPIALARSAAGAEAGLATGRVLRVLSGAERLANARRAQLVVNQAAGRAFENGTATELNESGVEFAPQITVQLPSGRRLRLDFVTREPGTGEIGCIDCKASQTAPVRPNQALGFAELEQAGATIVGKGKPGFLGGMKIPPTRVEIRRPRE